MYILYLYIITSWPSILFIAPKVFWGFPWARKALGYMGMAISLLDAACRAGTWGVGMDSCIATRSELLLKHEGKCNG